MRHAESVANVSGILAGRTDPTPLTAKGRGAARALAPVVASFDPEVSLVSPLLRCRQTSELAGRGDVSIDERLIEMDYGRWSGKSLKALSRRQEWSHIQSNPEAFTFPQGESFQSASSRLLDLTEDLLQRKEERFLLVSHGDICRILINNLLGRTLNAFQHILIEPASHSLLVVSKENNDREIKPATIGYLNRLPLIDSNIGPTKKFTLGGE